MLISIVSRLVIVKRIIAYGNYEYCIQKPWAMTAIKTHPKVVLPGQPFSVLLGVLQAPP